MISVPLRAETKLTTRRRKLRQRRRIKSVQAIWRSLLVSGIAGGLFWFLTLPGWVIRKPEQVTIKGHQFLSAAAIRSLLPLNYPQSLLRLQPQEMAAKLESQGSIATATVTRQLLPPELIVQVKERQPVAIAKMQISSNPQNPSTSVPTVGLLDENGSWITLESYTAIDRTLPLPTLKVIGLSQQYLPYWHELYQAVSRSPIKVSVIDCQDPTNLILKTELGNVHFGAYSSRFSDQLGVLDRMRELPNHLKLSQIAYIDLRNPESPAISTIETIC